MKVKHVLSLIGAAGIILCSPLAFTQAETQAGTSTRDILVGTGPGRGTPPRSVYSDSWALLIAIDDYMYVKKLRYAVADAEAMRQYLITTGGFSPAHVFSLYNAKATMSEIKTAIGTFLPGKAAKDDRVLIFFAGHGQTMKLPEGGQMGYLMPVEGRADNLYGTCISMSTIRETSKMIPSKHIFYIVDACYSGIAGIETRAIPSPDMSLYLKKLISLKAVQIMTAGQAREKVIEGEQFGGGHSVFSFNLISGLSHGTADENGDGIIPASELYAYLAPRVTRDSGGRQTPKIFNMHGDGEFVFFTTPVGEPAVLEKSPPVSSTHIPLTSQPTEITAIPTPQPIMQSREIAGSKIIRLFFEVVEAGNIIEAQELLKRYLGLVNAVDDQNYERTPLHYAAENGYKEVCEVLIEYGADVDAKTKDTWTPLYYAARNGHREVCEILIRHGANVNAKSQYGWTPLYSAARGGHEEVCEFLLESGAHVNAESKKGWTALHIAAHEGHKEACKILIDNGADVNAKDKGFKTPMDVANGDDVKKLLQEHGGTKGRWMIR
jgi:hypothetical protein